MRLPLLCEYVSLLWNVILSNQNKFQQIQVLIQEVRTIILYKLSTSIYVCWQPKFSKVYRVHSQLVCMKILYLK
jgi:hypothetical protein